MRRVVALQALADATTVSGSLAAARQQIRPGAHRRQRVAQVVAQHGDELLAQLGRGALARAAPISAAVLALLAVELQRDQLGEQL